MCNVSIRPHIHLQRRNGFTLLEVIIALAILALITGTIFAIVGGSTQATIEIQAIQKENRRTKAFIEELRRIFATFPSNGTIQLRVIEPDPLMQEMVIRNSPDAFLFGDKPVHDVQEIVLGLRRPELPPALVSAGQVAQPVVIEKDSNSAASIDPSQSQLYYLGLSSPGLLVQRDAKTGENVEPEDNPMLVKDEKGRYWMNLIPDLSGLQWHVWNPGKKQWIEKAGEGKPPRLKLSIYLKGSKTPQVVIFELL
ncbi:MAG: prepilin-type N-terminal cleavage/methylation domain-containing protein [Verrucomicrobiales bacterium]|jgi:prepilin-type N-terminal cleavage/methylation domain-containing protein